MKPPRFEVDQDGTEIVILDLAMYREMVEQLEDADATRAYDAAKARNEGEERITSTELRAKLEAKWAAEAQQKAG